VSALFEDRPPDHDRMGDHSAGLGADQATAFTLNGITCII
jgi:hypothetical protein